MRAFAALLALALLGAAPADPWAAERARVEIVRDEWGIAHVHGRGDADAVFGAIYAQAEDDFPRIERNYLTALGRSAEAEGEAAVWRDLRQRLWIDEADLRRQHAAAPGWLRALTVAWADGLNAYLADHPDVHPKVLTRFEPWMALAFSEGSIGGDIERVSADDLKAFTEGREVAWHAMPSPEAQGSNGIAIAPKLSAYGRALLLINPHTTHFFRAELQMTSDQGLGAYGASTWGQFFIYQGWNARMGWMHTSSNADAIDEFRETVVTRGGQRFSKWGGGWKPVETRVVSLRVRQPDGSFAERRFTTYRTVHGSVVRASGGQWISVALMNMPVAALSQSWLRTKAANVGDFIATAERYRANSSNNTLVADSGGRIAFLTPQFAPRRSAAFDYTRPVDGGDPATAWSGNYALAERPNAIDPATGWAMNTNDWPWSSAGPLSPKAAAFPRTFDEAGENQRGVHATALLTAVAPTSLTLEGLRRIAYDPGQPGFAALLPALVAAWEALPAADPRRARLAEPVALLRGWDYRWSAGSTAQTLATAFTDALRADLPPQPGPLMLDWHGRLRALPADAKLAALDAAVASLTADFGGWRVPWGDANRLQRAEPGGGWSLDRPSLPVPFATQLWGSLAAYEAKPVDRGRRFGATGNSFVAVVAFGPNGPEARAVSVGGENGDPASPHHGDQNARFAAGDLRPVWFTTNEVAAHAVRKYRPGG